MPQALASKPRIYRPNRFGYLMGLYGENYLKLQRMFAPEALVCGAYRSSVDDTLDLRLDVIERHPYTLELRLTYELCDPVTGRPDPSAFLRTYRDARLAEVTHCYVGRRWQDALELHPSARTVLAHRLQMNAFLNKWLDYLAEQGHSRATLQPIEALSLDASGASLPAA